MASRLASELRAWPLRRLVLLWGLLVMLALSVLLQLRGMVEAETYAWQQAAGRVTTELSRIAVVSERAMTSDSPLVAELLVHSVLTEPVALALIESPAGQIVASTRRADVGQKLAHVYPALHALRPALMRSDSVDQQADSAKRHLVAARAFTWPAAADELRSTARGVVYVLADVGPLIDQRRADALRAHAGEAALLALAWLLLLLAADRWLLRPLQTLREAATQLGTGDLDQRVAASGVRELQTLGHAINRMADNLQVGLRRLVESEQQLRVLTESAPDAIITVGEAGHIEAFNAAAERLFGYAFADVCGGPLSRLLPPGLAQVHEGHLKHFALAEDAVGRRMQAGRLVQGVHSSGQPLHLEVGISRSLVGGRMLFTAVIRDVSDRLKAEGELDQYRRQLEELVRQRTLELTLERDRTAAATRAKSEFLANMSHEIRTPMNAILGLAHLVRREALPEQAARLDQLQAAAQQLLDMLSDILDFTRLEAGQLALREGPSDLAQLVHAVCQPLSRRAVAKGLELVPWLDADLPPVVRVDEQRLRQVLSHLVDNAIKFTGAGHVTVRVRRAEGQALEGQCRLHFEVRDTGIGMSAEVSQRLFQPFEQAEPGSTRRFSGAGIGLVISQRLLRMMDASLQANSTEGEGSRFSFELPCEVVDVSSPAAVVPAAVSPRTLVIDSNDDARAAAGELLKGLGLPAETVSGEPDAVQALKAAQQRSTPFDLCLLDARMGTAESLALTQRLLSVAAPLKVLLLVAGTAVHSPAELRAAGAAGLLHKPLSPWRLREGIAALASGSGGAAPDAAAGGGYLEHVPGLRSELGVRNLMGNVAGYERLLRRFVQTHQHDAAQLRRLAQAGLGRQAYEIAHSLKSSAGAIGALGVAERAGDVPRGDAPHPVLQQSADRLADVLDELMAGLQFALGGEAAVASQPTVSAVPLTEAVQTLRSLLSRHDMAALRWVREHGPQLAQALGPRAPGVLAAVESFDFAAALHLLEDTPRATDRA